MKSKLYLAMTIALSLGLTISIVTAVNARSNSIKTSLQPLPHSSAAQKPDRPLRPIVIQAEQYDTSPALRELAKINTQSVITTPRTIPNFPLPRSSRNIQALSPQITDRGLQAQAPQTSSINLINNFEGIYNLDGVYPPDTQGDIGYDPNTGKKYYIQWVNLHYAIWDVTVTPTLVVGPLAGNTLWSGFGGNCATTNDGDPITLYDPIAHRWLMSQFSVSNPYYQCIAISATSDPTGSWYRYSFPWVDGNGIDTFNDYGKFGVWPDGYYFTANQFSNSPDISATLNQPSATAATYKGAGAAVFERDKMLNGQSARMIYFDLNAIDPTLGGMLPANFNGTNLPPANSPDYFAEVDDSALSGVSVTTDSLRLWKFHTDWTTPANSTFGINGAANYTLTVAPYTSLPCTVSGNSICIPQPGTSVRLDGIGDRLMYRLAYRNFGDHEELVVNHTVVADGTDRAGVRWYEVRGLSGSPSIFQQGTFAPSDGLYRWMGSIAMDHNGDLALGYSVASSSVYPSIRVTGRLVTDPLGTLPQGETMVITGMGAQTGQTTSGGGRWGDYSTMSIDPVDDCTFWYTQEYIQSSGTANWQTRVASFKFPGCVFNTGKLTGLITDAVTTNPISVVLVTAADSNLGIVNGSTDATGRYTITAPAGAYTVSTQAYGYFPASISGVIISTNLTTTQNFALSPAPPHVISGTVTDANTGWPLYAHLQITGHPIDPPGPNNDRWTDPVSGFYSLTLPEGVSITINTSAWVTGYTSASNTRSVTADATQNIFLTADPASCVAPGYQYVGAGLFQNFETWPPASWSIVDNITGTSLIWNLDSAYGDSNYTGGSGHAADVNSDVHQGVPYDTELRSPILNLTTYTSTQLTYKLNYQDYLGGQDFFDVDLSTDGGSSWTNLRHYTTSYGSRYVASSATDSISLTAYASQTNVVLRWHYYSTEATTATTPWDWYAQIDEVQLGPQPQCLPQAGGLVVGNTYSGTLSDALANVQVSNNSGQSFWTTATIDPQVADSFYTLFSPAGSQQFTATKLWLYPVITTTQVALSSTVRQDFVLEPIPLKTIYLPLALKNF